jgi:xanthine/CO dehydrogenase XdhC/CoxF family maturation factor
VGDRAADFPPAWHARLAEGCRERTRAVSSDVADEMLDGRVARVLYAPLRPMPRLLLAGAGLDVVPLVDIAARIGWRVTVVDHRPANLARGDLGAAEATVQLTAQDAARSLPLSRYAAAIVMNHHLDTDRAWLAELARSPVGYVGLLGPAARRERLLAELGPAADALRERLHAPVGLAIRADSPESIALAILAEIHATIAGRVDLVAAGRRA